MKIAKDTFLLDPKEVIIDLDLPRFRKEMGDLDGLISSIQEHGQIQPVVIDENNRLVAGGRRLACCLALDKPVLCIRMSESNDLERRILELEENLNRKNFTIEERTNAVSEIHKLKQEKFGPAGYGTANDGWTLEDTAKLLGTSRETVRKDIQISEILANFPELASCTTKDAILKGAKRIAKRLAAGAIEEIESLPNITFHQAEAADIFPMIADQSVDIVLTDPPYGVDFYKNKESAKKLSGADYQFDDSLQANMESWLKLGEETARVTKPDGHLYLFCGMEYFHFFRTIFKNHGWIIQAMPMVWHKMVRRDDETISTGSSLNPDLWPTNAYECLLFGRKTDSLLTIRGRSNVLEYARMSPSKRLHPHEKPVPLLIDMLERVGNPGDIVLDPFMGSGSTIEAAVRLGMGAIGIERDKNMHNLAALRLKKVLSSLARKEQENG